MTWGEGPNRKHQAHTAKKQGQLLRRAMVTPNGYTETNRKSRAKPLPEGLRKFFRPVGGEHA